MNRSWGHPTRALNRKALSHWTVAIILLLRVAYPQSETEGQESAVRDSMGVEIIKVSGGEDVVAEGWAVSLEPTLTIGAVDGPPETILDGVSGATVLSDGRIAVLDGGSREVRIFDEQGRFQRRFGRSGEGPGEFRQPYLAGALSGDTLVLVDFQLRRITLMDPDYGLLDTRRIADEVTHPAIPRGMFSDGTVAVGGAYSWSEGQSEQVRGGYLRPTTSYQSMALDGSLAAELGAFAGGEFHATIHSLPGGESSMSVELIPFSRHPVVSVGPRLFHVGFTENWEIRSFDPGGRLRRIIQVDRPLVRVTEQAVEEEVERRTGSDPEAEREIRRQLSAMDIPPTMPAFRSLAADALGFLWVGRQQEEDDALRVSDVFRPDGTFVGRVRSPGYRRILEIGDSYMLLLHVDDLGVETVGLHSLQRTPPS